MATDPESKATLIARDDASWRTGKRTSWTLPPDLQAEAVRRLRASVLIYALAYFLAGPFIPLLLPEGRALLFSELRFWLPASLSIMGALGVAWLTSRRDLSVRLKVYAGLAFEIVGSFGIAAAQYHDIAAPITYGAQGPGDFGLSWVAAWVLLFNVVISTPPRVALLWAVPSVAAVPLVYAAGVSLGLNAPLPDQQFFITLVFPYLVVLVMVYISSRVVSSLGAEIRRARELGSYRLVERLGQGGMGEVWRAQHRMLARPAAIKLIRPEVLGAGDSESRSLALRRFEREAQATALLHSPHTLELYDFGVADDGTFYYVMELLDGFDLDRLVEQFGPVPPERAVHLLLQVCSSLAEAHAAGLIHRDVKPANVYTCRYGLEVDFVKVLDFGLVKQSRRPDKGTDKLTAGDMTGGTPAFMSPEQALGEHRVDSRSDLYALGCVGYWLLTGSLVFQGETPMETIVMHAQQEPEPPSRRTEQPIPPDLEAIILACLHKDPNARPRSAHELAARLRTVRPPREWTGTRAREWWDRNRPEPSPS